MSKPAYISELFSSIQGEGLFAGRRQIFLRLMECNLDCGYCDTHFTKSSMGVREEQPGSGVCINFPQPASLQMVSSLIDRWIVQMPGAHHSLSITGGEPLVSVEVLSEWLPLLRRSLPIHLETNGTLYGPLREVKQHLDHISMDIKLPSIAACSREWWDEHARFLQEAHGTTLSVKVVVGNASTTAEIQRVCEILTGVDGTIPLFLQPLSLADGSIGIGAVHLMKLQEVAAARLSDVRVIPQMHKLLGAL